MKKKSSSQSGISSLRLIFALLLWACGASLVYATLTLNVVPGTVVLLSKSGSGALSSTSSNTSIFSPAAYVDYKRFGGEPTVTVDRYPVTSGTVNGKNCTSLAPCYRDTIYASSPNGFVYPHYSPFWKSDDLGQTFRVPCHVSIQGQACVQGGGGGDSHSAVGQLTHRLFFVDLPGPGCITNNFSDDLGETFTSDQVGCGASPGAIDDRQWVETDETYPASKNVYISFINFTNAAEVYLGLARSTHDGAPGTFVGDSVCNTLVGQLGSATFESDNTLTACPDPADFALQIAGPVVADKEKGARPDASHNVYIPFVRNTPQIPGLTGAPPYLLYIAKSIDGGTKWRRIQVANLGDHNPINLFPQLTIDRGGNLYYTWSQTQNGPVDPSSGFTGETDVFYAYSTDQGETWSQPIDLTGSVDNSAVMPWMVAGDPGQVDLVYYQSTTGENPNVNTGLWNTYFGQSQNALNTGGNFKNVQITDHPNHIGGICTAGLNCTGDRDLLDFITVDLDHLGAANVIWADDNTTTTSDTRNKFSRQLSGASVYKNANISLANTWPITDHSVTDRGGDVFNNAGVPNGSCPGMDVLGTSANRSGDLITVTMTLNAPPTAAKATACSTAGGGPAVPATGGLWGAEFWSAASDNPNTSAAETAENFYIAYRDNPLDVGSPRVEGGRLYKTNVALTSLEFDPKTFGAAATGSCFKPNATGTCTITMTISASALGIKPGAGMYSITGLSTYQFGVAGTPVTLTRFAPGNSEQADAATAFDINGTGTTTK